MATKSLDLSAKLDSLLAKIAATTDATKLAKYNARLEARLEKFQDKVAAWEAAGHTVTVTWDGETVTDIASVTTTDLKDDTVDTDAGGSSGGGSSSGAGAGSAYTLTTDINTLTGTSKDDTFSGIVGGASATYNLGDAITGGAGDDTLSLIVVGTSDAALVQVDGVENVSYRLLQTATADMTYFSGVTTVTIADTSFNGVDLYAKSADSTTDWVINQDHNLTVHLTDTALTGTTDNIGITLNDSGSSTDITALSLNPGGASGVIETISIVNSGSSQASLTLAGTGAGAVTVSGSGNLNLNLGTGANVSALTSTMAGSATFTFGTGAQHIVVGGAANETFDFGGAGGLQSTGSADTVNGGGGTDTVKFAMNGGAFEAKNLTNIEVVQASATTGSAPTINASGASLTNYILSGTGAFTINNASGNITVNLMDDNLTGTTVDMTSGNLAVVVGSAGQSATNQVNAGSLTVTDASAVTINYLGSSTTTTFSTISIDEDTKSLTIGGTSSSASASLTTTSIAAPGLTSFAVTTSGSGSITNSQAFLQSASSLASVSITAGGNGAGDIALGTGEIGSSTGVSAQGFAMTVTGTDSADFGDLAGVNLSDAVSASSVTVNLGSGSVMTGGFGTAIITGGSAASVGLVYVSAGQAATFLGGEVALKASSQVGSVTLSGASAGSITFDGINARVIGDVSITTNGTAAIVTGEISGTADTAAASIGNVTVSGLVAGSGAVTIAELEASAIGNLTFSNTDVTVTSLSATGSIGAITISGKGTYSVTVGEASSISSIDAGDAASGASVTFDLRGFQKGTTIELGSSTSRITEGTGQNTITLASGSGANTIFFEVEGQSADSIYNFTLGSTTSSAGDVISVNATSVAAGGFVLVNMGSDGATATLVANATAISSYLAITGSLTTSTIGTADYVVISATAFGNAAEMVAAIGTGGAAQISAGTALTNIVGGSTGDLIVVWGDGSNSYVTSVQLQGATALVASNASSTTIATLYGISAGALSGWHVTNIDFD